MSELHVVFGTGPLGKSTARALLSKGKTVRMVNRSGRAQDIPAEVEVVKGDAYQPATTRELTRGAAAVYQCAQPEYHEWEEKFPPLQASILEGAATSGATFVVGDNLYMYGDPDGQPLIETTPYNAHTKKGRVRAQMAEAVMRAHREGRVRTAVGRASHFFGPGYDILGEMLFYPALEGKKVSMLGRLDLPHTFTFVPDFGQALAVLGTDERALGEVWHVPSPAPITQRELVNKVFEASGHGNKVKLGSLSPTMVRVGGLFSKGVRETVEIMYEFEKPYVVDSTKFERTFGLKATPLDEAIRETVAWFNEHPKAAAH